MDADLRRWRADTPAVENGRVHLNNAGASLAPRPVLAVIAAHLQLEAELGGYEAADFAASDLQQVYQTLAELVGTRAGNIALASSATMAFAQALASFDLQPGDRIVTTRNDYISNQLMYLSLAQRRKVEIVRADDLPEGGVDPQSVRDLIREHRPALVGVTWIPTNTGLMQEVAGIGEVCSEFDVPYLIDGCQAAGQIPIDTVALRCDFLAATGRKFLRGPRGTGFLFVSDRMLEADRFPLLVDMRGARWTGEDNFELAPNARRFEEWEQPIALQLGLGAAARYALEVGLDRIGEITAGLATYTREQLAALPGVRVLDRGSRLSAIVSAQIGSADAREVVLRLREQAINASFTPREFALIDLTAKNAESMLRLSPHYYNTRREIDLAVSAIEEFVVG